MTELRPARPGEGAQLFAITRDAIAAQGVGFYAPAQLSGWMTGRDEAQYEAVIGQGQIVVAARGETLLGFAEAWPGEIRRLFVHPAAMGQGLGARLLKKVLATARRDFVGSIALQATLNAAPFYQRFGFVPVSRSVYAHPGGGPAVEIIEMRLPGP